MDNKNPSEAVGSELPQVIYRFDSGGNRHHVINQGYTATTYASGDGNMTAIDGRHGRSGGVVVPAAAMVFLLWHWWRNYDLEAQQRPEISLTTNSDLDLEAGEQAHHLLPAAAAGAAAADGGRHTGGAAAARVHEPSEPTRLLEGVMVQTFAAFLPACVTVYPLLKDTTDYIKFTVFGGLASITVGLFAGILCRSMVRRVLAIRLVASSAIAVLTFSVASQLSSPTFIALTAFVGVALNLIIMLLRL